MIVYSGVNDPNQPFYSLVNGSRSVRARYDDADSWIRAFGVPGMLHCRGGDGPTDVEPPMLDALVAWVERDSPPDRIVAPRQTPARGVEREFLLCPEPRRVHLARPGLDATRAENWECRLR
jgi:feruloyl esterase